MSAVERMMDMAETSCQNEDPLVYQLNLVTHQLRTDERAMSLIKQIHRILALRNSFPEPVAKIFEEKAEGLIGGLMATASKNGWFMNTLTMHRIKYSADSPEAKKMMHAREGGLHE